LIQEKQYIATPSLTNKGIQVSVGINIYKGGYAAKDPTSVRPKGLVLGAAKARLLALPVLR
jgi:hypothetical protein